MEVYVTIKRWSGIEVAHISLIASQLPSVIKGRVDSTINREHTKISNDPRSRLELIG